MSGIFTEQTLLAKDVHPSFAFILFWFLILWLAVMEGGQGSLVGLQRVDKERYVDSHPCAFKNTVIAHKGNNMERFIIGRQFLVVLFIFFINMCGIPTDEASVFDFNDKVVVEIFLRNGVAMMFITIVIGQLASQVNAAVCMLDFINNYFMLMTTYISIGIEFSGLLHAVYLVQFAFSKLSGEPIESKEVRWGDVRSCAEPCLSLTSKFVLIWLASSLWNIENDVLDESSRIYCDSLFRSCCYY